MTNLLERAETRKETFYKLTNSAGVPDAPSGNRNLYALSKNNGIYTRDITDFVQNVETGEISFKVTGIDPFFGIHSYAGNAYDISRGIKIPVKVGQDITVYVSNEELSRNYVSFFGSDNIAVKNFEFYNTNKFIISAEKLIDVAYITLRSGLEYDNNDVGKTLSTKVKVEYGNVYTDWSPAPEDLGWSATTLVPTQQQRYLWKFEYIYYSDGSVEVTQPVNLSIAGADADTTGVTDAINQTNQTVANLQNSVSQAQSDLATVSSNLTQARQDLESSIASVDTKAQAVETTLAQVQSTANANSQKTATLENNLDGLSARFSSLKIGAVNLLKNSKGPFQPNKENPNNYDNWIPYTKTTVYLENGSQYIISAKTDGIFTNNHAPAVESDNVVLWLVNAQMTSNTIVSDAKTGTTGTVFTWTEPSGYYLLRVNTYHKDPDKAVWDVQIERGNVVTDYSPNEADLELKVADYKQTADQNYASLQTTVQNLDGTVQQNKTTADQTAAGFQTRIESLETYQAGETTRANQYFESAKTETARQLTAERTAIANNYVAKSTYTSDVTGLRNDLTATTTTANTTKTNLASYQASNDQAVASLQSSLQTTDGNVSSLQTQINAVPGQITSAVSAVEGKIPSEIGGRNLYALSKNDGTYTYGVSEFTQNIETGEISWKTASVSDSFLGNFTSKIGTIYGKVYGIKIPVVQGKDILVSLTDDRLIKNYVMFWGEDNTLVKNTIKYTTNHFKVQANQLENVSYLTFRIGVKENTQEIGTLIKTKIKVEYGNVYTDWSPALEDTASQISSLSSQIQQTADGMTLLATKTELNTAKSDLQAGITTATSKADNAQAAANTNAQTISTHTTQISALNTGLQSKVSQSDFDSLSGDVDDLSSELTQTANSITASVSSVETKADNAQTTANSAVSKANAAQTAVNTLDSEVVKSASLNLDNNGFVTKVGKTIDGNKFATMIAQNANNVKIIADEMQVTADMIVDGAVTANKLNVNNLSAVNSNLGAIKGGSLLLQESKAGGSATDSWGTYNRPAYKQGLFLDNHAFASSGAIQRKNGSETTPTDMPLAVLQAGELRFLVADYNDNLENVVHYGLSDPDFGAIRFEIDSELKRRLTMTSSGYLNFQASNYTDWIPLSQQGCEYMIQGRLVVVNYDVTYSQGGTHKIGDIPQEFVKKELMLTAKAWSITPNDKNFQLNADGGLHLLNADANVTYRGTLLFSY